MLFRSVVIDGCKYIEKGKGDYMLCMWGKMEWLSFEKHHKTVLLNRQQDIAFGHMYMKINKQPQYFCGKLYKQFVFF